MLIYEVGSDDANVPILRVLCSRRYTAVTVENWTPPTSKTDSARKFGLDRMLELWLLFISWPIMPCKVRMTMTISYFRVRVNILASAFRLGLASWADWPARSKKYSDLVPF